MKIQRKQNNYFENPFAVGTVVDNSDPTYSYRVKVKVPIIHDHVDNKDLPWAARVGPTFLGFGSSDINHAVPEVGTQVLVLFIANNPNSILYLGSLYAKNSNTPSGGDYLGTYGIYTKNGDFIGVDKINQVMKMIYNGEININCPTTIITGNVKITGDVEIIGNLLDMGDITGQQVLTTTGINLGLHTHSGVFPGPSKTLPPDPS